MSKCEIPGCTTSTYVDYCALHNLQGPVLQEASGQAVIRWYVNATAKDRAKLASIGHRTRGYRVTHRAARARWERNGELALAHVQPTEVHRPHVLRLYFRSMADEILCCESVHSAADASRLHHAYQATPSYRESFYVASAAVDAQIWPVREKAPVIGYGARFVLLPSQAEEGLPRVRAALAALAALVELASEIDAGETVRMAIAA